MIALLPFLLTATLPLVSAPKTPGPAPLIAPSKAEDLSRKGMSYAELQAKIAAWKKQYPNLVHEGTIGSTLEGRPIVLLRLSDDETANPNEPGVLIMGGIHPREQQPPMCIAWLTDELLAGYGKDARMTKLLKERQIYLIPVLNVDGKVYDETGTPGQDWRKNRRPNNDKTTGVDLNRNFPVRWGGYREEDASWHDKTTNTKANIYEGTAALSEPESAALAAFLDNHAADIQLFVDFHSPLRKVLTPAYLFPADMESYKKLIDGVHSRQTDSPYPATDPKGATDPKPGVRPGDSGLTYTYAYDVNGIFGMNIEIGLKKTSGPEEKLNGSTLLARHYPTQASIRAEYEANIREPFLFLLEAAGDLPKTETGTITVTGGKIDKLLTPGAVVTWTPVLSGDAVWTTLTSGDSSVVVESETRHAPVTSGFTLHVAPDAKPGQVVPLTLTIWDKDRKISHAKVILTITK